MNTNGNNTENNYFFYKQTLVRIFEMLVIVFLQENMELVEETFDRKKMSITFNHMGNLGTKEFCILPAVCAMKLFFLKLRKNTNSINRHLLRTSLTAGILKKSV